MLVNKFKRRLFFLILIAKLSTLVIIWFEWSTHGLSTDEFTATLALILPLFTVYSSLMFKEYLKKPYQEQNKTVKAPGEKKIKRSLVVWAHLAIPIYALILIIIIILKPNGDITFSQMQLMIGFVESGLGVYIGQLIFTLFKTEE